MSELLGKAFNPPTSEQPWPYPRPVTSLKGPVRIFYNGELDYQEWRKRQEGITHET